MSELCRTKHPIHEVPEASAARQDWSPAEKPLPSRERYQPLMGRGDRVLIADAEAGEATAVADYLESSGKDFVCETAVSGQAALDRIHDVDCLVAGYEFPDMTGLELLDTVRNRAGQLPFILFPEAGSEMIASNAIAADVTDYVSRDGESSTFDPLAARVDRAIRDHQERINREERARRLELLVENLPGMVYRCRNDPDWPIESIEGDCRDVTGYPCTDIESGRVSFGSDIILPDDRDGVWETVQEALESNDTFDHSYRIQTAVGGTKWVAERGQGIYRDDGQLLGIEGFVMDITERKRRESELEQARERYQSLFENNPFVLWENDFSAAIEYADSLVEDPESLRSYLTENPDEVHEIMGRVEIIDVNQNALEYYRADSKGELVDNLDQLMTEESWSTNRDQWHAFLNGASMFRDETKAKMFDGTIRDEIIQVYVPGAPDDYSRAYVTGTDITERKQREDELERQNERLEEVTSVVSHDLRNPLNVAAGRLALAREECDSDHLERVARSHDRMTELIDDLLTLASTGRRIDDPDLLDIYDAATSCWQNVSTSDAELVVELDRPLRANNQRFKQLLENLFRNSVEHSQHAVLIRVGALDKESGFFVEDDGPGVDPEHRELIFERGYSSSADGTGFGLAIVERIAESHGWSVRVTDGPDGGARFEFTGVDLPPSH